MLLAGNMSCSSDSGSDSDATPTTASATSFDRLNLNTDVDYPDSLKEVSSLALAGRSREACEIGSLLNMTSQSFQTSASLFCAWVFERTNTKYKLVLQRDQS